MFSKPEMAAIVVALCSESAAKEFVAAIAQQRAPSANVQNILALALGDQLNAKRVNAVQELIAKMTTGKKISLSTNRKLAIMFGSTKLANSVINAIQTTPTALLKI